jgi:hypothetical protein
MEDIDEELGALLDNYNNKFEGSGENHKRLEENQAIRNAFNELVENVIRPGMNKFSLLLSKKGFRCSILHEAGHQIGSITMSLNYKKLAYTEFISAIPPQIKFRIENMKISINESKFDPSGLGCSVVEGTYDIHQITESFINSKLKDFLISLFNREWKSYDFE